MNDKNLINHRVFLGTGFVSDHSFFLQNILIIDVHIGNNIHVNIDRAKDTTTLYFGFGGFESNTLDIIISNK